MNDEERDAWIDSIAAVHSMQAGDMRDFHHFALLARLAPKLSRRGKLALYSGIYSKGNNGHAADHDSN